MADEFGDQLHEAAETFMAKMGAKEQTDKEQSTPRTDALLDAIPESATDKEAYQIVAEGCRQLERELRGRTQSATREHQMTDTEAGKVMLPVSFDHAAPQVSTPRLEVGASTPDHIERQVFGPVPAVAAPTSWSDLIRREDALVLVMHHARDGQLMQMDASYSMGHNGNPDVLHYNAGCMVCGMMGPDSNTPRDAADRWNALPRRTLPPEGVALDPRIVETLRTVCYQPGKYPGFTSINYCRWCHYAESQPHHPDCVMSLPSMNEHLK